MATTIGSGLGGFAAIAAQPTYGNPFVTPTRALNPRQVKMTYNPHIVQGGPYLANNRVFNLGSAHIDTWLDATGTLSGEMMTSGQALLLATAFGSSSQLTQIGTTTAYGLGGLSGITMGDPATNNGLTSGTCFDMQLGVPTTDAIQRPENYHSCVITKATWVFDRAGLCTFEYELDSQYVEKTTSLISPSFTGGPVAFSMSGNASFFKAGAYGAEVAIDGVRKATFSVTRKMATDRIYIGNQYKELPITNGIIDFQVSLDVDYTSAAKSGLFDLFLAGTPTSIIVEAIGAMIGTSGIYNTFGLNATNAFVQTGGESPLDGPDIVKNTIVWAGTIDAANDSPLKGWLYTGDTGW